MIPLFLFNCCLLILILSGGLELEGERHYHYDEMVVMRDGISLHTVVFLPNDPTNKRYPAVVDRSPYGYNITEWLSDFFLRSGYVAIGQDLRGQFKSQGDFSIWHSDFAHYLSSSRCQCCAAVVEQILAIFGIPSL